MLFTSWIKLLEIRLRVHNLYQRYLSWEILKIILEVWFMRQRLTTYSTQKHWSDPELKSGTCIHTNTANHVRWPVEWACLLKHNTIFTQREGKSIAQTGLWPGGNWKIGIVNCFITQINAEMAFINKNGFGVVSLIRTASIFSIWELPGTVWTSSVVQ